jgi:hypothetical protein
MPDRLKPVWHFHDAAKLTPGSAGKVKITALGCQQFLFPTKLCKKPQITTGLT